MLVMNALSHDVTILAFVLIQTIAYSGLLIHETNTVQKVFTFWTVLYLCKW
ncbi:hypothetical protein LZ480_01480 [Solibacillus sp. MA9]|uniref:Uncharacterized protein n=1 Tax=Solibacillus palustris TaxID=2908203 RepID=A0ABS9U998_9BACL|nr:hypothetical protein [Solibacillus sp. MA9]MCH7320543.1 hypothetical protein [Solibacillus sp. MA9]